MPRCHCVLRSNDSLGVLRYELTAADTLELFARCRLRGLLQPVM
jgi:hypothetical protein